MYWLIITMLTITTGILGYLLREHIKIVTDLSRRIEIFEKTIAAFKKDQRFLLNADMDLEKRLNEANRQLLNLDKHIQQLNNTRSNDGGYHHALKILSMGGSKEEVMDSCHISRAEADLLLNLHTYRLALDKTN